MLLIVGGLVVFVATLGGFMMAGGQPMALLHISEFVVIGGVAAGILIIASPKEVLMNIIDELKTAMSGAGVTAEEYTDLLKMLYEMFMLGRRSGLIALDEHVSDPKSSSIISQYPSFLKDQDRVDFLVNALRPIIDGKVKPEQLGHILEEEIETKEEEAHASTAILTLVADSLPGVGIVAAVLGIINTMSAISEGPERVGQSVAAALTGTFLGIFFAYGFISPFAKRVTFNQKNKFKYYSIIANSICSFAKGTAPLMAIEVSRRSLEKSVQPAADELEEMLKNIGK